MLAPFGACSKPCGQLVLYPLLKVLIFIGHAAIPVIIPLTSEIKGLWRGYLN